MLKMLSFYVNWAGFIGKGYLDFIISIHEEGSPRGVTVVVVDRGRNTSSSGFSVCAPEDTFDIRVGVPLALRRALAGLKELDRSRAAREFFRKWPEAHPEYRTPSSAVSSAPLFPTYDSWIRVAELHTNLCGNKRPFEGWLGCDCALSAQIRASKWANPDAPR